MSIWPSRMEYTYSYDFPNKFRMPIRLNKLRIHLISHFHTYFISPSRTRMNAGHQDTTTIQSPVSSVHRPFFISVACSQEPSQIPHFRIPLSSVILPYYHRSKMDYNNFHMTRCRPSREGTGIRMLIRNLILPFPFCLRIIHTNTTLVTLKIQNSESSNKFMLTHKIEGNSILL